MKDGGAALQALLAQKIVQYRGRFELACAGLFGGGASVTVEFDAEDDESEAAAPGRVVHAVAPIADGAPTLETMPDIVAIKRELELALQFIADDFAHDFNARLSDMAREDPSTELIAPRYEMGPQHIAELHEIFGATLKPLIDKLDAGDLEGARRATIDAWTPLEKRIRSKWQAYFVLTFQDVSVERKAARDRRRPSFDAAAVQGMAQDDAARRALPERASPPPMARGLSPWVIVAALLLLTATVGWLLMRHWRAADAPPSSPAVPVR